MSELECPRCHQEADRLIKAYWNPLEHPGYCPACCQIANRVFDDPKNAKSWPEVPKLPWWFDKEA